MAVKGPKWPTWEQFANFEALWLRELTRFGLHAAFLETNVHIRYTFVHVRCMHEQVFALRSLCIYFSLSTGVKHQV